MVYKHALLCSLQPSSLAGSCSGSPCLLPLHPHPHCAYLTIQLYTLMMKLLFWKSAVLWVTELNIYIFSQSVSLTFLSSLLTFTPLSSFLKQCLLPGRCCRLLWLSVLSLSNSCLKYVHPTLMLSDSGLLVHLEVAHPYGAISACLVTFNCLPDLSPLMKDLSYLSSLSWSKFGWRCQNV